MLSTICVKPGHITFRIYTCYKPIDYLLFNTYDLLKRGLNVVKNFNACFIEQDVVYQIRYFEIHET